MVKDKNADKRNDYNLKISENERKTYELKLEKKEAVQFLEDFEESMRQSYKKILEIEEDINRRSHHPNAYSETEQEMQHFSRVLSNHQERMIQEYDKAAQALEDTHEKLQKERDNLPWD